MTLVLVVRTREGIAIVSDTVTTANSEVEMYGEMTAVEYHIYNRRKLSKIENFAVVHAGLSFLNGKTINQIVDRIPDDNPNTIEGFEYCLEMIKNKFIKEIETEPLVKGWEKGRLILSLGIIGYNNSLPFVYRLIFLRSEEDGELYDLIESEDAFVAPYYGIDYFGDYEFVQLVIRAAKKENLLKPFDILTIYDALELARELMRFLIEFQKFMVTFTVAYPVESVVITEENGFEWVDRLEYKKFHYDHDESQERF
ncbi:MAG: hypothetical protein GPJ54_07500 [Candidatus Heimdallarchaeota archaeon]|nr:hypothetical protein [Candidatus Heimdallarchaeota archaeon]